MPATFTPALPLLFYVPFMIILTYLYFTFKPGEGLVSEDMAAQLLFRPYILEI
jgi:hypothetical protein